MGGSRGGGGGGGSSAPAYVPPPPPIITSQMSGATGGGAPIVAEAPEQQQGAYEMSPSGYVPTNVAGPAATSSGPQGMLRSSKNPYATQRGRPAAAAAAAANQKVSAPNDYQAPNINGLTFGGN